MLEQSSRTYATPLCATGVRRRGPKRSKEQTALCPQIKTSGGLIESTRQSQSSIAAQQISQFSKTRAGVFSILAPQIAAGKNLSTRAFPSAKHFRFEVQGASSGLSVVVGLSASDVDLGSVLAAPLRVKAYQFFPQTFTLWIWLALPRAPARVETCWLATNQLPVHR